MQLAAHESHFSLVARSFACDLVAVRSQNASMWSAGIRPRPVRLGRRDGHPQSRDTPRMTACQVPLEYLRCSESALRSESMLRYRR